MVRHIDHIFDEAWGYLDTEDILKFPFFQELDKKKKGKKGKGKDAARAARAACAYNKAEAIFCQKATDSLYYRLV